MAKENNKPNSYIYHRQWFDFQHENMDRVSANHIALYLYTVEINNRLGWVKCFGLTVREAMDGMRCKSRNTYLNTFHDLVNWGFFKMVKASKNQYQCNVIALPIFKQAKMTFFDISIIKNQDIYKKSLIKNSTPIDTGTGTPIDTGTGTIHQTSLPINQYTNLPIVVVDSVAAINFFCQSKIKITLEEKYKITGPEIEKKFMEFYNLKIDLNEFDNKNCGDISRHFSNWLPGEIIRENNFKKNNKNGTKHKSGIEQLDETTINFYAEKYGSDIS